MTFLDFLKSSRSVDPLLSQKSNYTLVIHGGAGTMSRETSTPAQREAYRLVLRRALRAGHAILSAGGEALDAATAAVTVMEDSPLFNAGKGAVFNEDGKNELEASVMLSKPPSSSIFSNTIPTSRRGIGATLLTRTRNPSQLVRALYLNPDFAPHAFLSGDNVESIGESLGLATVDPSYFWTEHRWKEHMDGLDTSPPPNYDPRDEYTIADEKVQCVEHLPMDLNPKGTVGAVALDVRGCIVACTSTGGRTNKHVGRIGDTPIFGCGFWSEGWENKRSIMGRTWDRIRRRHSDKIRAVGVSGTGDGDYFIRLNTCSTLAQRVKLNQSLDKACQTAVNDLRRDGGDGGIIALNDSGRVSMKLNCGGMYRGVIKEEGIAKVAIFHDDVLS